jgi:hypothetical protein
VNWIEIFKALSESNLHTVAFGIGAIACFIAILGQLPVVGSNPISGHRAALLALFGVTLMCSSGAVAVLGTTGGVGTPPTDAGIVESTRVAEAEQPSPPDPTRTVELTPLPPPPTPIPPVAPTPDPTLSSCDWLAANFPQTIEGIATNFELLPERLRMIYEDDDCEQVANGFVIEEGPTVQMSVPEGGCIDAPKTAYFSQQTTPDGVGGLRAYGGEVHATVMTYRPWC